MSPSAVQSNLSPLPHLSPPAVCLSLAPASSLDTETQKRTFPKRTSLPLWPPPLPLVALSPPRGLSLSRCCPPFWVSRLLAKGGQRARGTPVRPSINLGRARATLSIPRN